MLLVVRFVLKLGEANAANAIVATVYAVTEPVVTPFVGIFLLPPGAVVEIPALLAIAFLVLLEALLVALVRAASPR